MKNNRLKEKIQHGDASMGISVYETAGPLGAEIPLYMHWHNEMEIFSLVSGRLKMHISGDGFIMEEGDTVIIKPGGIHGSDNNFGTPFRFRAVLIQYEYIAGMTNDLIAQKYFHPLFSLEDNDSYLLIRSNNEAKWGQRISLYLGKIAQQYAEKKDGYELLIKALAYQVFYEIYQFRKYTLCTYGTARMDIKANKLIKEIIEYINNNYQNQITLQEIAARFSMSEGYFCRYFKKYFHVTFGEYLTHVRLREVEKLLIQTDYDMERIATETGFSSAAYLSVSFKREYQTTPVKYRRQNR